MLILDLTTATNRFFKKEKANGCKSASGIYGGHDCSPPLGTNIPRTSSIKNGRLLSPTARVLLLLLHTSKAQSAGEQL